MSLSFDGRVVVLTGACGSLGRHYAMAFAERGAKLLLNDLGTSLEGQKTGGRAAEALAEELRAMGAEAVANEADIANRTSAEGVIEAACEAFGGVDVLFNNAGIMRNRSFRRMTEEDFRHVFDVHVMGTAWLCQAAMPVMAERGGGRIILTTSAGGLYGAFGVANYGAAKTSLLGLMHVLAIEGARSGVLINTIAPIGESRMMDGVLEEADGKDLSAQWVVPAGLLLASDACTESGTVLVAGGGHYARAAIVEGPGVSFCDGYPSVEDLAAQLPAVLSLEGAKPLKDLSEAFEKALGIRMAQR